MNIRLKIAKLQMHGNLHKNVNETLLSCTFNAIFMSFNEEQLKQQICYSIMLLTSHMGFNPFRIAFQFF